MRPPNAFAIPPASRRRFASLLLMFTPDRPWWFRTFEEALNVHEPLPIVSRGLKSGCGGTQPPLSAAFGDCRVNSWGSAIPPLLVVPMASSQNDGGAGQYPWVTWMRSACRLWPTAGSLPVALRVHDSFLASLDLWAPSPPQPTAPGLELPSAQRQCRRCSSSDRSAGAWVGSRTSGKALSGAFNRSCRLPCDYRPSCAVTTTL